MLLWVRSPQTSSRAGGCCGHSLPVRCRSRQAHRLCINVILDLFVALYVFIPASFLLYVGIMLTGRWLEEGLRTMPWSQVSQWLVSTAIPRSDYFLIDLEALQKKRSRQCQLRIVSAAVSCLPLLFRDVLGKC